MHSLHQELERIDLALEKLEQRRTALIHRMCNVVSPKSGSARILYFPNHIAIAERETPANCAVDWPRD